MALTCKHSAGPSLEQSLAGLRMGEKGIPIMRKFVHLFALAFVMMSVFAVSAAAQDAATGAPKDETMLELIFRAGGIFGYVIIFCSIVGLALLIEHAINITRDKSAPPEVIETLESHLDNNDVQGAYEFCEQNPGHLTNIMAAALPKAPHGFDSMHQAAADVAEEEAIRLSQKIGWVSLIGNLAPLLGLLGTVSGMLAAFGIIERTLNPTPSQLGGGIKEALVTTLLGLVVAIPLSVGYFYFRNKVTRIVLEVAAIYEDLLDRFRPHPTPAS